MYSYAFEILKLRIATGIAELRDIDWYLEQDVVDDKQTGLYAAPGLYFEFIPAGEIRSHGGRIQSQITDIAVHVISENLRDRGSERLRKTQPKDHMLIVDKANKILTGFSAKLSSLAAFVSLLNTPNDQRVMNSLTKVGFSTAHQLKKGIMKSTLTFRCVIYDHSAKDNYTKPNPLPDLEIDLGLEIPQFESSGIFDDTFDETFE